MNSIYTFFATAPKFMEDLLVEELTQLDAQSIKLTRAGAFFKGTLQTAYRICLWSRIANRILYPLTIYKADSRDNLYQGAKAVCWDEHMSHDTTFAVDSSSVNSRINHSKFVSLVVKDAIVDYFKEKYEQRPSVDIEKPALRLNLYLNNDQATLSVDLSGDSLHRRKYRIRGGLASLKENVAAAMLLRANWPDIASKGGMLVDPMCGSGTICIEAALIAGHIAPGIFKSTFGFMGWKKYQEKSWKSIRHDALKIRKKNLNQIPLIIGFDRDPESIHYAQENIKNANLDSVINASCKKITDDMQIDSANHPGLVALNPPYGKRQGEKSDLKLLYNNLGKTLLKQFNGWSAAVLTSDIELSKAIPLRAVRVNKLYNGPIKCLLVHFDINEDRIYYGKAGD